MYLIALLKLREDAKVYPNVLQVIELWYQVIQKAQWSNLEEVQLVYRDAESR